MSAFESPDGTVVVWREPVSATARRLARRSLLPAVAVAAWLLDLTSWAVVTISVAAAPSALLLVFGLINLAAHARVTMVHTAQGALVWPRSVQEVLLRSEADHVVGERVEVLKEFPSISGARSDPRVTFTAGDRSFERFPLHGTDVDDFIAHANDVLAGRGMQLVRVEPPELVQDQDVEEPESESESKEFDWPDDTGPDYDPDEPLADVDEPPDEIPRPPQRD